MVIYSYVWLATGMLVISCYRCGNRWIGNSKYAECIYPENLVWC